MKNPTLKPFVRPFLNNFIKHLPQFLKYQLIIRSLLSLAVLPLFWLIVRLLINSRGVVTNSSILEFIFSVKGAVFSLALIGLMMIGVALEVGGLVIVSCRIVKKQPEASLLSILKPSFKLIPQILGMSGILLMVYFLVLSPLFGGGFQLSFLGWLTIPGFIQDAIFADIVYTSLFLITMSVIICFSFLWSLGFHFMIIGNKPAHEALRQSRQIVTKNLKTILSLSIKTLVVIIIGATLAVVIWLGLVRLLIGISNLDQQSHRIIIAVLLVIHRAGLFFLATLALPLQIHFLSHIFYTVLAKDRLDLASVYPQINHKIQPSLIDKLLRHKIILTIGTLVVILFVAAPISASLDLILRKNHHVETIAHRAGGFLAPENSLLGLNKAIGAGATWAEIDIQRSADNQYLVFHDTNLKRLTGKNGNVLKLNLAEAQQLSLGEDQTIASLEQMLDFAKDKIKLMIELKGKTADKKMADDVVRLLEQKQMTEQAALISLDAQLISYTERTYPEISSGTIYFLAMGDLRKVPGQFLIVEESLINQNLVHFVHAIDKKIFAWTVNSSERARTLTSYGIDGIITDYPNKITEAINKYQREKPKDSLFELF